MEKAAYDVINSYWKFKEMWKKQQESLDTYLYTKLRNQNVYMVKTTFHSHNNTKKTPQKRIANSVNYCSNSVDV